MKVSKEACLFKNIPNNWTIIKVAIDCWRKQLKFFKNVYSAFGECTKNYKIYLYHRLGVLHFINSDLFLLLCLYSVAFYSCMWHKRVKALLRIASENIQSCHKYCGLTKIGKRIMIQSLHISKSYAPTLIPPKDGSWKMHYYFHKTRNPLYT